MNFEIIDNLLSDEECEAIAQRVLEVTVEGAYRWRKNGSHIAVHTEFPALVRELHARFGFSLEPQKQMALLALPGDRGVQRHGHNEPGVLFYPWSHPIGLMIDDESQLNIDGPPQIEIEVRSSRLVFIPKGFKHAVRANDTTQERLCVPILYHDTPPPCASCAACMHGTPT